eukprot:m.45903 g.45903  ORF g.45903 m.45903 type:complete len:219 (+) comp20081_c0_seq1:1727-2383(+)
MTFKLLFTWLVLALVSVVDGQSVNFTGYLSDNLCLIVLTPITGINITLQAPNHTKQCLLLEECVTSGYSVMEEDTNMYKVKYQFDAEGARLAEAAVRAANCETGFLVTVSGTEQGAASYQGTTTYNGGATSFGTILATTSLTVECAFGETPSTTSIPSSSSGLDELDDSSIQILAALIALAAVIIAVFEILGSRFKVPKGAKTTDSVEETKAPKVTRL